MKTRHVITSRSNERVKALREGFRGRASRPGELVSVEGRKLLEEALNSKLQVEAVFLTPESEAGSLDVDDSKLHILSKDVFGSAVETRSPQGVAALVRIPDRRIVDKDRFSGTSLLVENVQDPGNLGTLLRSAEAFGAEAVFVAGDTVNPWSPKVIRASAGSIFRVPVVPLQSADDVRELTSYAAVVQSASAQSLLNTRLTFPCVLMVGNEGSGLSPAAVHTATHQIWIPCATESLNAGVAGSLLLYEATRQRSGL